MLLESTMLPHRDTSTQSMIVMHIFFLSSVVLLATVYMLHLQVSGQMDIKREEDLEKLRIIARELVHYEKDQANKTDSDINKGSANTQERDNQEVLTQLKTPDTYYSKDKDGKALVLSDSMEPEISLNATFTGDQPGFHHSNNSLDTMRISYNRPNLSPLSGAFLKQDADETYINLLDSPPPEYLPNYRNPCWAEPLHPRDGHFEEHYWWGDQLKKRMMDDRKSLPEIMAHRLKEGVDWKIRCLPYFYIAGVTKCGTTDLFHQLSHHPLIVPSVKETHWWSRLRCGDANGIDGVHVPIKQYIDLMDSSSIRIEHYTTGGDSGGEGYHPLILGDGSPSYFWYNERWRMRRESNGTEGPLTHVGHYLRHLTPDIRIILCFRDPVSRTYSHYQYTAGSRASQVEFHGIVLLGLKQVYDCLQANGEWYCANFLYERPWARLNIGMYVLFLEKWFEVFPREQFFILRLEDYASNRTSLINQIFRFLDIGEIPEAEVESWYDYDIKNQQDPVSPMLPVTKQLLTEFFRPYNQRLASLLQDDKYLWT